MRACPGRSATRRSSRRGALQSRGRREHGAWYGPGSAERHEECRTASGTRALSSWNPSHMPPPDSPWLRHHRQRWLRHDAHLWIRPDAARFFPPGTDPAVINPTLPRKPDAAKAAVFEAELAAEVAKGYRLLAVLREQVAELRAELKRRRALEEKYSPSQPRVPAGNPRGGQWTDRSGGQGTVAGPSQDTGQSRDADLTQPMGNVGIGDVSGSTELDDLFQIRPSEPSVGGVQLAGDIPERFGKRSGDSQRRCAGDSTGETQHQFAKNRILASGDKLAGTKFGIGRRDLCRRDE